MLLDIPICSFHLTLPLRTLQAALAFESISFVSCTQSLTSHLVRQWPSCAAEKLQKETAVCFIAEGGVYIVMSCTSGRGCFLHGTCCM